jgi:hypothetical protein
MKIEEIEEELTTSGSEDEREKNNIIPSINDEESKP